MKLFLLHRCPFGHRASIVLQEKKLAFEPVFFQLGKRPPELEDVGSHAKSPTLIDGGTGPGEFGERTICVMPSVPAAVRLRSL